MADGSLTQREALALMAVQNRWMRSSAEDAACFDVLIPEGYINAEGTWYLTPKGHAALAEAHERHSILRAFSPSTVITPETPLTGDRARQKPAPIRRHKASRPLTYAAARAAMLEHLRAEGWRLVLTNPSMQPMKVPHATSPDGRVRVWFKPQAVYYATGSHDLSSARSLHTDIRTTTGEQFLRDITEATRR